MFPGLVVAIMDHEHFRLKLLYKQKKKVGVELKEAKDEMKGLKVQFVIQIYVHSLALYVLSVCMYKSGSIYSAYLHVKLHLQHLYKVLRSNDMFLLRNLVYIYILAYIS